MTGCLCIHYQCEYLWFKKGKGELGRGCSLRTGDRLLGSWKVSHGEAILGELITDNLTLNQTAPLL